MVSPYTERPPAAVRTLMPLLCPEQETKKLGQKTTTIQINERTRIICLAVTKDFPLFSAI